ncbi:transcriptional regulator, TetR family [Malonomonas rubra DSM 5091]|uniref:Transcriptional regulator, TetR family n=1 Tax=Malonomonas rubra DSM 5091 TaxID=1122189 RepID=A0A1M6LHD7_MALRU|nr:TetR/AcrR family transcriptional regulator [Malonomonas rubra]SHJ70596.1 transcriptional regulator, TetR family [Malonomonas rubra DSM 5091]
MAGLREQKKAETRKAIIDAAVQLFSNKGFEKTSIEDIATVAGIGKATVYTYFSAKVDIFLTYCDDELEGAFSELATKQSRASDLHEQLLEFFMIMFRFVTRDREFGRQLMRATSFPEEANPALKEHNKYYFDFLENIFRSAAQRGEIATGQDYYYLSAHVFSLYFAALAGFYGGYSETAEDVENGLSIFFRQFIDGIKP